MSKNVYNMAGRQEAQYALFELTRENFDANGGVIEFEAPTGGVLLSGVASVIEVFDGTAPTFDIGDEDDPNRYTSAPISGGAVSRTDLDPDDFVFGTASNSNKLIVTLNGGDGGTAGRLRIQMGFLKFGKADHTQGNKSPPSVPPNPGPNY